MRVARVCGQLAPTLLPVQRSRTVSLALKGYSGLPAQLAACGDSCAGSTREVTWDTPVTNPCLTHAHHRARVHVQEAAGAALCAGAGVDVELAHLSSKDLFHIGILPISSHGDNAA